MPRILNSFAFSFLFFLLSTSCACIRIEIEIILSFISRDSLANRAKHHGSDDDDDQAFEKCNCSEKGEKESFIGYCIVLQEHRTRKSVQSEEKPSIQQRQRNRNRSLFPAGEFFGFNYGSFSLKDFIRNSSSSSADEEEEDPLEFYPKVNRLIDQDSSWRQ